jgi:GDP-4-dehydro-6-deoxy-D-mannose reductase
MRAYVTGAAGFVGRHLAEHLERAGDEVIRVDSDVDVTDADAVHRSLGAAAPDVVYHLAGLAHVGRSWSDPVATFTVNALGTLNVLEGAAACSTPPRVITVSSAEVYGTAGATPVTEEAPMRPVTPYAASKAAAELVALQAFLGRHLPVVRVRPFNHVGAGQSPDFVVSALARRIVEAEQTGSGVVSVGNLDAERDFTDVRDVVRAYRLLAVSGQAGEVYNVASGRARSVRSVADQLVALAARPVDLVTDPALMRPSDVPVFVGDATRLREATGWEPEVPLEETLSDVLDDWRARL